MPIKTIFLNNLRILGDRWKVSVECLTDIDRVSVSVTVTAPKKCSFCKVLDSAESHSTISVTTVTSGRF
jgi:hypothetical protein